MTLTVAEAKKMILGDVELSHEKLGLGTQSELLFSDAFLGNNWAITHTKHDADLLILWGSAVVGQEIRDVETRFFADETEQYVAGLAVYADLNDDWNPKQAYGGIPAPRLSVLKIFRCTHPELSFFIPTRPWLAAPLFGGSVRFGNGNPAEPPTRVMVIPSSPGYYHLVGHFAPIPLTKGIDDLKNIPFVKTLEQIALPSELTQYIRDLPVSMTGFWVEFDTTAMKVIHVRVTAEIRNKSGSWKLVPDLVTADRVEVAWATELAHRTSVTVRFLGKLGESPASVYASWSTEGDMQIVGEVRRITGFQQLPLDWLKKTSGIDLSDLSTATIERLGIDADLGKATHSISVYFTLRIPVGLAGNPVEATLSTTLEQTEATPKLTSADMTAEVKLPIPTEKYPDRQLVFHGTVDHNTKTGLRLSVSWSATVEGIETTGNNTPAVERPETTTE